MIHAKLLLMILALLAFGAAALGMQTRFNLVAVGLFCWALSLILIV